MANVVLDTSAVLALINNERGADQVARVVADGAISSVNLAETISKLVERGGSAAAAKRALDLLDLDVADFTRPMAEVAGAMAGKTRAHGLSLGDRACLALAAHMGLPALTADRIWAGLDLGVEVVLIR